MNNENNTGNNLNQVPSTPDVNGMTGTPNVNDTNVIESIDSLDNLDSVGSGINNPNPTPMDTLNNNQASMQNVPPINSDLTNNVNQVPSPPVSPVANNSYEIPEPINGTKPLINNDIGTVPPVPDIPAVNTTITDNNKGKGTVKDKKKMSKIIFVIIILLALVAVGVAVYILLYMSKVKQNKVSPLSLEIEVGSVLSSDINDYATFNGIDATSCSLDTTDITDTSILGEEYTFKIICNETTYVGKATIVDKTPPEVTLKEASIFQGGSVAPEDFIESCIDNNTSEDGEDCTYEFKDKEQLNEYLKTTASYHIPIIVKDKSGNEVEVNGTLKVVESISSSISLVCSKDNITYKFGLDGSDFNKLTLKIYEFKFNSEEEYQSFKSENSDKTSITYQNITGSPEFNDTTFSLTLTSKPSYDELCSEIGAELPTAYGELRDYFETEKGYTCSVKY